jgi:ssDNA-binding Zn-finger/Zn-ribbon topoisomerase 1
MQPFATVILKDSQQFASSHRAVMASPLRFAIAYPEQRKGDSQVWRNCNRALDCEYTGNPTPSPSPLSVKDFADYGSSKEDHREEDHREEDHREEDHREEDHREEDHREEDHREEDHREEDHREEVHREEVHREEVHREEDHREEDHREEDHREEDHREEDHRFFGYDCS